MGDYRKLQVWEHSHRLAVRVFKSSYEIPRNQRGDVADQLRRSAISVPANIVEGCGVGSEGGMLRHFRIALGSANELEYLLLFCRDGKLLPDDEGESLVMEANGVRRMLAALINRVMGHPRPGRATPGAAEDDGQPPPPS